MRNYVNKQEIMQRLLEEIEQSRSNCIHINTINRLLNDIDALSDKEIRTKVIDEFAEKFIYKAVCSGCSGCTNCYEEQRQCECEDWKSYMEIAEQIKQTHECD